LSGEEDSSWDSATEFGEFFWCFEELDDFGDFVFGFFDACDIFEGDACHFFGHGSVFGFSEGAEHSSAACGAAHGAGEEEPDDEEDDEDWADRVEEEDEA